jgi:hypothetical protein
MADATSCWNDKQLFKTYKLRKIGKAYFSELGLERCIGLLATVQNRSCRIDFAHNRLWARPDFEEQTEPRRRMVN